MWDCVSKPDKHRMNRPVRHSWGDPMRFACKTERERRRCGIIKITRHEGSTHWTEFWRGLDRYVGHRTPPCDGLANCSASGEARPR